MSFWIGERKATAIKEREEREYQIKLISEIPRCLKLYERIIVQAPTGSGKSHIINETVKKIMNAGKTALVLSDNITIHGQLLVECNGHKIDSKIKFLHIFPGQCYVAMSQSLSRRDEIIDQLKKLPAGNLVIILDEAHRNSMTPIAININAKWMIAFTATPHYRWAKHLEKVYKHCIVGPQISELIGIGKLSHYKHIIRTQANLVELKMSNGEYTEESQDKVFGGAKMYEGLYEDLPKQNFKKCVIYVASIKLCEEVYEKLKSTGYNVTRYHSNVPRECLDMFTKGSCNICVSVSALTLGWDYPPIDLIILWRATTSLVMYLQICGRGGRPLPDKTFFTVLDYGGNYDRFGPWDMDRDWSGLWKAPPKKRTTNTYAGVAGSKECPICHMLLAVASRSCFNCGYIYPESEIALIEGQIMEVRNSLDAMNGKKIADFTIDELILYAREVGKKQLAIRVAKRMEQERPGFLLEFALRMNYSQAWVNYQKSTIPTDGTKIEFFNAKVKI